MKFTVDCECTPEEARAFLGLPDVKPMQEKLLKEMEKRITGGMRAMTPEDMMRYWMPNMAGMEQLQSFFSQMTGMASGSEKKS